MSKITCTVKLYDESKLDGKDTYFNTLHYFFFGMKFYDCVQHYVRTKLWHSGPTASVQLFLLIRTDNMKSFCKLQVNKVQFFFFFICRLRIYLTRDHYICVSKFAWTAFSSKYHVTSEVHMSCSWPQEASTMLPFFYHSPFKNQRAECI